VPRAYSLIAQSVSGSCHVGGGVNNTKSFHPVGATAQQEKSIEDIALWFFISCKCCEY